MAGEEPKDPNTVIFPPFSTDPNKNRRRYAIETLGLDPDNLPAWATGEKEELEEPKVAPVQFEPVVLPPPEIDASLIDPFFDPLEPTILKKLIIRGVEWQINDDMVARLRKFSSMGNSRSAERRIDGNMAYEATMAVSHRLGVIVVASAYWKAATTQTAVLDGSRTTRSFHSRGFDDIGRLFRDHDFYADYVSVEELRKSGTFTPNPWTAEGFMELVSLAEEVRGSK